MKANELKQPEKNASKDEVQVKKHQVFAMQFVFIATVAVVLAFVASSRPDSLLAALNAFRQGFPVYAVIFGFLIAFMQLNHLLADELRAYINRLQSHQSEVVDYLRQQMGFWRQLFSSFLAVNPRPKISFFDRLSDLLSLTQLPLLSAPLAFRS